MPLYEYRCHACGERFESIRKFSDPPLEVCARCGQGPIERLLSSPAIQFKGAGWYITDYAQKDKKKGTSEGGATKPEGGSTGGDSAKTDTPASTTKSESSPSTTTTAPSTKE